MNTLPVLGAPLHWHPALLALTVVLVPIGAALTESVVILPLPGAPDELV